MNKIYSIQRRSFIAINFTFDKRLAFLNKLRVAYFDIFFLERVHVKIL